MNTLLAIILSAQVVFSHRSIVAPSPVSAGEESSPGTTSLIAWYDFADETDSHNAGPYDLTEIATPEYTSGPPSYGTSVEATTEGWSQASLSGVWMDTDANATMVIRFRPQDDDTAIDYMLNSHNGGTYVRWYLGALRPKMGGVFFNASSQPTQGTWMFIVVEFVAATDTVNVYIDGSNTPDSDSGTYADTLGTTYIGGSSTSDMEDIDYDFVALYNRQLTEGERAWLYNSGSTRTYGDL